MKYIYINAPWNHGENAIGCTNDTLYEGAVEVTFEEMMKTSFKDKRYLGIDISNLNESQIFDLAYHLGMGKSVMHLQSYAKTN